MAALGGFVGIGDDVARAFVANGPGLAEFAAQQGAGEVRGFKGGASSDWKLACGDYSESSAAAGSRLQSSPGGANCKEEEPA
jgi:hypothetical protein